MAPLLLSCAFVKATCIKSWDIEPRRQRITIRLSYSSRCKTDSLTPDWQKTKLKTLNLLFNSRGLRQDLRVGKMYMKVKAEEPRFTEMTAVNKAIEALAAPFKK